MSQRQVQRSIVRRLRRLQALTLVAVVATAGLLVYGRFYAPAVVTPAPVDDEALQRAVVDALREPLTAQAQATETLRARTAALEEAATRLKQALDSARVETSALAQTVETLRRAANQGLRPIRHQRWTLLHFRNTRRNLEVAVSTLDPERMPAFDADADTDVDYTPVSAQPTGSVAVDMDLETHDFQSGVLFVTVALQTDNSFRDDRDQPNRMWIRATSPSGQGVDHPVFAHFFRVDERNPADPLLKTSSCQIAVAVAPGSRLEFLFDAVAFGAHLHTAGTGKRLRGKLDVLIGLGPLIADRNEAAGR
jgi:hypothetical protein